MANWSWAILVRLMFNLSNIETGFAIFTLVVTGLLLRINQMTRQAEQKLKLERVPVRIKRNSLN